jgi:hypothetical protein
MAKCVKIDKEMILEFSLEYDLKSDTMIDSTGVTWMRME